MIAISKVSVSNIENAFRGMRNPLQSWSKSDYYSDIELAKNLISAGTDHSKFMRQIFVSMDIKAPLYWWKEMDTYKVGTTSNSTSTMHSLHKSYLGYDDFSFDSPTMFRDAMIENLNRHLDNFKRTGDKIHWRSLIQDLPSSYNQLRTWTANYQVLRSIFHSRANHKLSEWHGFLAIIEDLPYKELIIE
jgi:hypothetical protein